MRLITDILHYNSYVPTQLQDELYLFNMYRKAYKKTLPLQRKHLNQVKIITFQSL